MYSRCTFCFRKLGLNESIDRFRIGQRLAFDSAKGRLWVVCLRCDRWNLTPIEERWETIEDCERLFRASHLRVSSDNIGLARVERHLDLVRVGRPSSKELALWRYGDVLARRRRRNFVRASVAGAVWGTVAFASSAALPLGLMLTAFWRDRYAVLRLPLDDSRSLSLTTNDIAEARLERDFQTGDWALAVKHRDWGRQRDRDAKGRALTPLMWLHGAEARRAAALLLPRINGSGAEQPQVHEAVEFLESNRSGDDAFRAALAKGKMWKSYAGAELRHFPPPLRLALEMAVHEDTERRAMEGDLALLERSWREAEEIAAIADGLLTPPHQSDDGRQSR